VGLFAMIISQYPKSIITGSPFPLSSILVALRSRWIKSESIIEIYPIITFLKISRASC
jgi:hypothetical protein